MSSESLISIYHTGFIVCLAFSILFFITAIILFFVFDIKAIFNIRTGRAQKKKIEEMAAQNALTGRLMPTAPSGTLGGPSTSLSTKLDNIRSRNTNTARPFADAPSTPPAVASSVPIAPAAAPIAPSVQNIPRSPASVPVQSNTPAEAGSSETTLLNVGAGETSLLNEPPAETSVLSAPVAPAAQQTPVAPAPIPSAPAVQKAPVAPTPAPNAPAEAQATPPVHENVAPVVPNTQETAKAASIDSVTPPPTSPVAFEIGQGETVRLTPDMIAAPAPEKKPAGKFTIVREAMLIHTDEMIM